MLTRQRKELWVPLVGGSEGEEGGESLADLLLREKEKERVPKTVSGARKKLEFIRYFLHKDQYFSGTSKFHSVEQLLFWGRDYSKTSPAV